MKFSEALDDAQQLSVKFPKRIIHVIKLSDGEHRCTSEAALRYNLFKRDQIMASLRKGKRVEDGVD
jgi:hypothetical protein